MPRYPLAGKKQSSYRKRTIGVNPDMAGVHPANFLLAPAAFHPIN
jgi:hypothetical protein